MSDYPELRWWVRIRDDGTEERVLAASQYEAWSIWNLNDSLEALRRALPR